MTIDANSIAIGAVSGVGIFVVGKIILKGLGINSKPKNNPNNPNRKPQYKDTCDAIHEGLDNRLASMDSKLDQLLSK